MCWRVLVLHVLGQDDNAKTKACGPIHLGRRTAGAAVPTWSIFPLKRNYDGVSIIRERWGYILAFLIQVEGLVRIP